VPPYFCTISAIKVLLTLLTVLTMFNFANSKLLLGDADSAFSSI